MTYSFVHMRKYAYGYRGSRNGHGRGGHSIEPNPYSMKVKIVIKGLVIEVNRSIIMVKVVISTLIPCSISFTHRQVRRFRLLPTVYIRTRERCQLQSKNNRFCALSYNPYTKLYIWEFLRNVLIPWNTDGRPDLSSRIESGFSPDSF